MQVLIVDDDPAIREIFSLLIARGGHIPHAAAGGREALELLQTVAPDVIVLDIMMRPMDGWDTLTAIRTGMATRDLPVTMFSGKPPAIVELLKYGGWIDDYLMKPLEMKTIPLILAGIVERCRLRDEEVQGLDRITPAHLADEFRTLRRSVFLYRKYASIFSDDDLWTSIRLQEERLRQIQAFLPPSPSGEKQPGGSGDDVLHPFQTGR